MTGVDEPAAVAAGGIAALVRDRLGLLSPAERKVGRALLAAYPSAGLESVARLAERAQVSAPTVVRFAKRLGFDGFAGLQRALRAELDARDAFPLTRVAELRGTSVPAGTRAAVDAFEAVAADALKVTVSGLPVDELDAATSMLADDRARLTLVGGRFSRVLAHYLALHLAQLRPAVRLLPDSPVERAALVDDLGRRDVVVVFDFRRYEPSAASLAAHAANRGARVVLVTDRWLSPVAATADVVLPTVVDSISAYDSFVPAMAVVELLVDRVVARLGDDAERRLARFERTSQDLGLL